MAGQGDAFKDFESWTQAYDAWSALAQPERWDAAGKSPPGGRTPCCTPADAEESKSAREADDGGSDVSTHMDMDDWCRCLSEPSVVHPADAPGELDLHAVGSHSPLDSASSPSIGQAASEANVSSSPPSVVEVAMPEAALGGLTDLTAGWARALARDLLAVASAEDFQERLRRLLREAGGPEAAARLEGRGALCEEALGSVLSSYGYQASAAGLEEALAFLGALAAGSPELGPQLSSIYASLGRAPPSELARGAPVPWSVCAPAQQSAV